MMDDLYLSLQETYMDTIHVPDYLKAEAVWDKTLFHPLQKYLLSAINFLKVSPIKLKYIGCGPEAPILFGPENAAILASHISEVELLDISLKYLNLAAKKINSAFPKVNIRTSLEDLTCGEGLIFAKKLNGIEKIKHDELIPAIITLTNEYHNKINSFNKDDVESNNTDKSEIVYSEMIATFTGTAAMLELEKSLIKRNDETRVDWKKIKSVLRGLWQSYNDYCILVQVLRMKHHVKGGGLICIATDVEKKFNDQSIASIYSFTSPSFPTFSFYNLKKIDLESCPGFWWEDDIRSSSSASKATETQDSLLPHKHRIEFGVYTSK